MEHGNTHLIISIYYKASHSYLSSENTPTLISWLMLFMCTVSYSSKNVTVQKVKGKLGC